MKYMLDTNICIHLIQHQPARVIMRFRTLAQGDVVMSVVTYAELRHGVERDLGIKEAAEHALARLVQFIPIITFDQDAAIAYGELAAAVRNRKRDALDRLIGAHAVSLGVTLVTNNERDFAGYPNLAIENWLTPKT
jgi:tRNA(fMet)-specific endonuclease VapC